MREIRRGFPARRSKKRRRVIKVTELTEITRSDVDEVVRTLMTNNAYTIMDNIEGEDKFGTAPVRDAYFGLASTKLIGNLDAVSGFINKNQYPAPMNALASEWGAIGNVRFLLSSIGSVSPNASSLGNDVFNIFVVGKQLHAHVKSFLIDFKPEVAFS